MSEAKTKCLAPWYGSNRMLAPAVGEELAGCRWVGVPFAGGMAEIPYIKATAIVVNDIHRHVMNLACVLAGDKEGRLARDLEQLPFHPDVLAAAQTHCKEMERGGWTFENVATDLSERWALNYFIASWMNRSALAGTDREFTGGLPIRWSATGGDSNVRYRSAVASLKAWQLTMARCNFSTLDALVFIAKVQDKPGHGIYLDPPFPGPGDDYRHKFSEQGHRDMAVLMRSYKHTRIVCRFYDHPLIRELYPEGDKWTWRRLKGRDQSNNDAKPELLIINGPSYATAL